MGTPVSKVKALRLNLSLKLIIGCSITLIGALGVSFYVIAAKQERLIMTQVENEARILFQQIVITRKWIADHGGIFIEKLPWVKPSPYLREPQVRDKRGKAYIKETPAMVTKELSRYAKERGLYWFHITSLKLTNPANAPDDFEKKALLDFERDTKEIFAVSKIGSSNYLRFISPLFIEKPCLKCHAWQGYKVGDVRGAISITIPVDKTLAEIEANRKSMFVAGALTVLALMVAMLLMMKKLVLTPVKRLKSAIREFSDGRYARESMLRTGDEFEDLCHSFSDMAGKLTEYHDCLNDKIRAATRDLEETNNKLQEANMLLNEINIRKSGFIAHVSHELRTPLTSIKGAMDYVSVKLASFPQHYNVEEASIADLNVFLNIIKKNSERLIRMVNDLLDLEQIEMGPSELHFTESNLTTLIHETITYFQIDAGDKGIRISVDAHATLPVSVDEDRIRQVLINLISNAMKFSPEGAEIRIHAYGEQDSAIVEVRDNCPRIRAEDQGKVFEKFYKNGNKEGAGLGLAICKSIVEAHNGVIGLCSNGEKGNCFYFRLPRRKELFPQDSGCSLELKEEVEH